MDVAQVTKWAPYGVALNLKASDGTIIRTSATTFTVSLSVSWETYYSGAMTNFGMEVTSGGKTITLNKFGTKSSGDSATLTGTYSISGNGATTKTITVRFRNFNDDYDQSATRDLTLSISVPAWTSYTVKYNANGGSGAPGNQTKWKNQTLALSSTKPTRTGYTFQGWSTSASGSVVYSAGASYTANAGVTLYAVWKAYTYTVKYDAKGGIGAPDNQTKTYGVALTLSNIKPVRDRYKFLGWGIASSATTVSYAPGDVYTDNAPLTLYAIWDLAYQPPRIFNVSINRCDVDGNLLDDGRHAKVSLSWECDNSVSAIIITWRQFSDELSPYYTQTDEFWAQQIQDIADTSGSYSEIISISSGPVVFDPEISYDMSVRVMDTRDITHVYTTLPSMIFAFDALAGGKGVAFGKAAEMDNTAEFEFDAKFNGPVYGRALGMDKLPEIPENSDFNDYLTTGCYAVYQNVIAATIANIPVTRAGRLEVWSSTGEGLRSKQYSYLRQRFVPYNKENAIWERDITRGSDNVWTYSDWWRSTLTPAASEKVYHDQKVLWDGEYYMSGSQTATLSEAVSAQANGIVLVFSRYSGGVSHNYHFNTFFIPKKQVELLPGYGHTFLMTTDGSFSVMATKYMYIHDTYIAGNAINETTGTGTSGVKYENNGFVLRYVIGV